MAKAKKAEEKTIINMEAYQKELAALQARFLKDVDEKEKTKALDDFKKGSTKTLKSTKSSLVNTKYQTYIDDLMDTKELLNKAFKDSEPVIFIQGQSRTIATGKLVGYNSSNGDIWVEFKNEKNEIEVKSVKGGSVITNIGMIPVPKASKFSKK